MKISKKTYMKVEDKTGTQYYPIMLNEDSFYIEPDYIESMFEDLLCEIDSLEEKIEDMEENIRENYRPISPYEMYGVNERDFH